MTKMKGYEYLAEAFKAYDVSNIFLVPTMLVKTLAELEYRTDIQRIVTHGEKSAVYMADAYARVSGKVGICFGQTVGAANIAAALRDPFLACTPMIALTGGAYPSTRGRHTYQQIEDYPLFKSVTKDTAYVDSIDRLPDTLRQAFRTATTGTPGPVHIQLRDHMGEIELEETDFDMTFEPQFGHVPPFRPEADDASIQRVAELLGAAQQPIIVAGGGARTSGAHAEIVELAESMAIPVATALNAKEIILNDHPLAVGVPGNYSRRSANRAVAEADLVFFIGSHTGSQVTWNWRLPAHGTTVIQLDINPEELGRHYPNTASLLGDAKASLQKLLKAVDRSTADSREGWIGRTKIIVQEYRDEIRDLQHSDAVPIRPERITKELTDLMPPDTILVSDTGHSGLWSGGMIDLAKPGQGYIRCAGSLGWGLPAALGAKLGAPDRPVVLWTGDGGLWYHWSEIETAVRWNINAIIMVNNNHSLNQEIPIWTNAYGGELTGRHGDLWQFNQVDFAAMAESMGATGIRVTEPGDLQNAIERAFAADGPVVLDVVTDINAQAPRILASDVSG